MFSNAAAKGDRLKIQSFPSETQAAVVQSICSHTLRTFSMTQRPIKQLAMRNGLRPGVAHRQTNPEPSFF